MVLLFLVLLLCKQRTTHAIFWLTECYIAQRFHFQCGQKNNLFLKSWCIVAGWDTYYCKTATDGISNIGYLKVILARTPHARKQVAHKADLLIGALSGTVVNARAMDDTGLPGHRDSKSVLPHASQEPICLADVAWPVRDNKLALLVKESV